MFKAYPRSKPGISKPLRTHALLRCLSNLVVVLYICSLQSRFYRQSLMKRPGSLPAKFADGGVTCLLHSHKTPCCLLLCVLSCLSSCICCCFYRTNVLRTRFSLNEEQRWWQYLNALLYFWLSLCFFRQPGVLQQRADDVGVLLVFRPACHAERKCWRSQSDFTSSPAGLTPCCCCVEEFVLSSYFCQAAPSACRFSTHVFVASPWSWSTPEAALFVPGQQKTRCSSVWVGFCWLSEPLRLLEGSVESRSGWKVNSRQKRAKGQGPLPSQRLCQQQPPVVWKREWSKGVR